MGIYQGDSIYNNGGGGGGGGGGGMQDVTDKVHTEAGYLPGWIPASAVSLYYSPELDIYRFRIFLGETNSFDNNTTYTISFKENVIGENFFKSCLLWSRENQVVGDILISNNPLYTYSYDYKTDRLTFLARRSATGLAHVDIEVWFKAYHST